MSTEATSTTLHLERLSVLVSTAVPVHFDHPADAWLTLRENLRRANGQDDVWLNALDDRRSQLLLPEYAERYQTLRLGSVIATVNAHSDTACVASLDAFVSLVRDRFMSLSLWMTFSGNEIPSPSRLSSAWVDANIVDVPASWARSLNLMIDVDGPNGRLPTKDAPRLLLAGIHRLVGSHRNPYTTSTPHVDARFDATVAVLRDPPDGFGSAPDPATCRQQDWRFAGAELLPLVRSGSSDDYRPDFLLSALGEDVMDSISGHYFIGRRRVLAFLDHGAPDRDALARNTVTWTQLLCENAAVQLAAIRSNSQRLQHVIDSTDSPARSSRSLTRSQYLLHQDLDEARNVAISLDPVFWHHLETLKRISGLSELSRSLIERMQAFVSVSALDEQRTFATAAQVLTVLLSAFALATPALEIAMSEDADPRMTVLITALSALLGGALGLTLILAIDRRGQRMNRDTE